MKRTYSPEQQPRVAVSGTSPGFKKSGTPPPRRETSSEESRAVDDDLSSPAVIRSPQEILELLTMDSKIYKGNIVNVPRLIAARAPNYSELLPSTQSSIDTHLWRAYADHLGGDFSEEPNITPSLNLFSHQAEAIEAILKQSYKNICIATSTSSGKSLAFNLPIISELLHNQSMTALYLYPTKALTQDQKRVIDSVLQKRNERIAAMSDRVELSAASSVVCGIVDGDVKELKERIDLMKECNLVLSNPDMLHYAILPNHTKFSSFLKNLKYVVIDEAHCYDGAFGSHVASVIRRLRRIVDKISNEANRLTFLTCSATIGNPQEHVSRLVGIDCDKLVHADGSPTGDRLLTVWNSRLSESISDTISILTKLAFSKVRFICFCKNRFLMELVLKRTTEELRVLGNEATGDRVVAYRAGYTPADRRRIEERIFSNQVFGVIATSALELGMDIGSLDVAISMGYPGSIHSLWQQWGRAGRSCRDSLCMLLCREEDVVDAWISQDSDRLLEQGPEDAVLQTNNPNIVKNHLICADVEMRFMDEGDWDVAKRLYWGGHDEVEEKVFTAAKKEAPFVKKNTFSIRNIESRRIIVNFENQKIDEMDITQAFFYVHPGAVHHIQGIEYRVVDLSLKTNTATVVKANHPYFTRTSDMTTVTPVIPVAETVGEFMHRGRVDVALKVKGFYRVNRKPPHDLIDGGYEALELPAIKFGTCAVWLDLENLGIEPSLTLAAAHGASHAIFYSACQRLLLSKQSDIKCDCQIQNNAIMIYDSQNGGLGISDMIFKRIGSLVHIAIGRLDRCPCLDGCIKCIFLSACSESNQGLNKGSTIEFLRQLQDKLDVIFD